MASRPKDPVEALAEPEEVRHEDEDAIWLLSYADLMTLMFTFFMMLYASQLQDDGAALRRALASFIQGDGQASEAAGAAGESKPRVNVEAGAQIEPMDLLRQALGREIQQANLDADVQIRGGGAAPIELILSSSLLFDSGSAELRPSALVALQKLIGAIRQRAGDMGVRVEGHTDDAPIKSSKFVSNWELSGARAARIAGLFEISGMPVKQLYFVGFGSSRPIAPNRTPAGEPSPEGMMKNRRVVLSIYKIPPEASPGPDSVPSAGRSGGR